MKTSTTAANLHDVIEGFFARHAAGASPETAAKREILKRLIHEWVRSYEGGETKHLSPRYATGSLPYILGRYLKKPASDPEPVDSIKGGNSRLIEALERKTKPQLNRPLVKVTATAAGLELTFKGEPRTVRADILVLAIPAKPYGAIEFGPGTIEAGRIRQIQEIGYGTHTKLLLPGPEPKAQITGFTEGAMVWRRLDEGWHTVYLAGPLGIMQSQADFQRALEAANTTLPKPLRAVRPFTVPARTFERHTGPLTLSWALDPYIQGSYSHFRADTRAGLEHMVSYRGVDVLQLFTPVQDKIFFAGEHTTTDPDTRGTMEAAVLSGVNAARMIKALLGN